MGFIIGGVLLGLLALGLYSGARGANKKIGEITAAQTYTVAMLNDLYKRVTAGVGADALSQQVELLGTIECDAPLSGPVSGKPVVAYDYAVVREYEEDVTETDAQGQRKTTTRKGSEQQQNESKRVPLHIRDETGRILLLPDGAELELEAYGERFDGVGSSGGQVRTLGRRHTERALPVGTRVYILGSLVDNNGQPAIARNPRQGKFLLTRRSEQELVKDTAGAARGYTIAAAISAGIGVVLVIMGLMRL